jgi:transposase InsO family protein
MQVMQAVPRSVLRTASLRFPDLSSDARRRLKWITYYHAHGGNAALTCRHFDIPRPTFYRWLNRYDPKNQKSLEDRSSVPKRQRQRTWTSELVSRVKELREKYPAWGKDKLARLIQREGIVASTSMIGRILTHLKRTRQLIEPVKSAISAKKRRKKRTYAVRKPKDLRAIEPGDIVQVDTLDVRPLPGVIRKQFTARDRVSRYDVLDIRSVATAKMAAEFVDTIIERMPFKVKAIQIDNGSEFMAEFEETCQKRKIRLYVLPPRSPKLNGTVERAQRTHTEEFWEITDGDTDVESMRRQLRLWESVYDTIRPHQALGYLTPSEYVHNWRQQQSTQQVV